MRLADEGRRLLRDWLGPSSEHGSGRGRPTAARRRSGFEIAGCLASAVVLTLLPKCPACLAAYVAVGTGSRSPPGRGDLRVTLVVLCIGSMSYLGARAIRGHRIAPSRE